MQDKALPTNGRRQAVLRREGPYVRLNHLDTAAFLFLKKVPLASATQVRRNKYDLQFYDPDERSEQLALDYVNGAEVSAVDFSDAVRRIKTVIYQFSENPTPQRGR